MESIYVPIPFHHGQNMTWDNSQFSAESTLHGTPPVHMVITSDEQSEPDAVVIVEPEIEMVTEKYMVRKKVRIDDMNVESENETFSNASKIDYKKESNDINLQHADQISQSDKVAPPAKFCELDAQETEATLKFWTDIKTTDVDDQQVIARVEQSHINDIVFDFDAVEAADEEKFVEQQEVPVIAEGEKSEIDEEEMQSLPGETPEETDKRLNEIRMYAIFVHSLIYQSLSRHGRERYGA